MHANLRRAYLQEIESARRCEAANELDAAFSHLERAHILSQRHTGPHARVHLDMLRVGWKRRDAREVLGQAVRTLAAIVFSRLWVPIGNTGGSNVSALRPMPVPDDLKPLLEP
jgi:hypothetical protein